MQWKKPQTRKSIQNILLITAGTTVLAFGVSVFLIPFELVTGGVSGLAIVLAHLFSSSSFSVELWVAILTWLFFLLGLVYLGIGFALRSLLSSVLYPPLLALFLRLVHSNALGGVLDLHSSAYPDAALLLASVGGGIVLGCGCALTFLGGGSSGGCDILAFVICKGRNQKRLSNVIFWIDTAIILLGVAVIRDLVISALGVLSARVGATVIDRLLGKYRF